MQRNHVALNGIDNYVATWKLAVYSQFSCGHGITSLAGRFQIVGRNEVAKAVRVWALTADSGQGHSLHEVALEERKDQQNRKYHHGRGCHQLVIQRVHVGQAFEAVQSKGYRA